MEGEWKSSAAGDTLGAKLREIRRERGAFGGLWASFRAVQKRLKQHLRCRYHVLFHRRPFRFEGEDYEPFFHVYNKTWTNERAIEIPILRKRLQERAGSRILEVGNVLSHYFPVRHEVVDKYESQPGIVANQDIVDFNPPHRYGLIVSISTLEHVGWDETPREEEKVLRAVEKLKSLLEPGGMLIATVPVGHNAALDRALDTGRSGFDRIACLKRVSPLRWQEASWEEVRSIRYGQPFSCANGLVVGFCRKAEE